MPEKDKEQHYIHSEGNRSEGDLYLWVTDE